MILAIKLPQPLPRSGAGDRLRLDRIRPSMGQSPATAAAPSTSMDQVLREVQQLRQEMQEAHQLKQQVIQFQNEVRMLRSNPPSTIAAPASAPGFPLGMGIAPGGSGGRAGSAASSLTGPGLQAYKSEAPAPLSLPTVPTTGPPRHEHTNTIAPTHVNSAVAATPCSPRRTMSSRSTSPTR